MLRHLSPGSKSLRAPPGPEERSPAARSATHRSPPAPSARPRKPELKFSEPARTTAWRPKRVSRSDWFSTHPAAKTGSPAPPASRKLSSREEGQPLTGRALQSPASPAGPGAILWGEKKIFRYDSPEYLNLIIIILEVFTMSTKKGISVLNVLYIMSPKLSNICHVNRHPSNIIMRDFVTLYPIKNNLWMKFDSFPNNHQYVILDDKSCVLFLTLLISGSLWCK